MAEKTKQSSIRWFGIEPKLLGSVALALGLVAFVVVRAQAALEEGLVRAAAAPDLVADTLARLNAMLTPVAAGVVLAGVALCAVVVRRPGARPIRELTRITVEIGRPAVRRT